MRCYYLRDALRVRCPALSHAFLSSGLNAPKSQPSLNCSPVTTGKNLVAESEFVDETTYLYYEKPNREVVRVLRVGDEMRHDAEMQRLRGEPVPAWSPLQQSPLKAETSIKPEGEAVTQVDWLSMHELLTSEYWLGQIEGQDPIRALMRCPDFTFRRLAAEYWCGYMPLEIEREFEERFPKEMLIGYKPLAPIA